MGVLAQTQCFAREQSYRIASKHCSCVPAIPESNSPCLKFWHPQVDVIPFSPYQRPFFGGAGQGPLLYVGSVERGVHSPDH
jgi:hypothetical protein